MVHIQRNELSFSKYCDYIYCRNKKTVLDVPVDWLRPYICAIPNVAYESSNHMSLSLPNELQNWFSWIPHILSRHSCWNLSGISNSCLDIKWSNCTEKKTKRDDDDVGRRQIFGSNLQTTIVMLNCKTESFEITKELLRHSIDDHERKGFKINNIYVSILSGWNSTQERRKSFRHTYTIKRSFLSNSVNWYQLRLGNKEWSLRTSDVCLEAEASPRASPEAAKLPWRFDALPRSCLGLNVMYDL